MRRVEVLYIDDCPNYRPAVDLVKDVVSELGLKSMVEEVRLTSPEDARRLRFLGSPSIRVDGIDVEPAARQRTDYGFSCRTYAGRGLPPRAMLEAALTDGVYRESPERPRREGIAAGTAVGAAVVSSACCWLPLALTGAGITAAGVAATFEASRPYLLTFSFAALAFGFHRVYVRKPVANAACDCSAPSRNRLSNRLVFWAAAVAVVAFAALPNYLAPLRDLISPAAMATTNMEETAIRAEVAGMTCASCSVHLQSVLGTVPGVLGVDVANNLNDVVIRADSANPPSHASVLSAIERAGFTGKMTKSLVY